jgi:SHS2 domain-containing protein
MNLNPTSAASGFEERQHTADIAIYVWAETLEELFIQAAKGMFALLKPQLSGAGEAMHTTLSMQAPDAESLLVLFLSELLYFSQDKGLLFNQIQVTLNQDQLYAGLRGNKLVSVEREIKAVTYSELNIVDTGRYLATTLVFDI